MKAAKIALIFMAAAALVFAFSGAAFAFHDGGVAYCEGCHTMHNSLGGVSNSVGGWGTPGADHNQYLLKGTDPSSTCLNCHSHKGASYNIMSTDGSSYTPGGDFYWLSQTYTYSPWAGNTVTSQGQNHGHSIVAADFGLSTDTTLTVQPGAGTQGTYYASNLACNSCHNPHGRVNGGTRNGQKPVGASGSYGTAPITGTINGNYRLLADTYYQPGDPSIYDPAPSGIAGYPQAWTYIANAPVAVTAKTFREVEGLGTAGISHTDYGSGIAEWCANCHQGFLNNDATGTTGTHRHPAGDSATLGSTIAGFYNEYVSTGNITGTSANAYLPLVPFERGKGATLSSTSTAGPDGTNAAVMCLSCHRAHASAFDEMTRWDTPADFISGSSALVATAKPWAANAPYYGWDIVANMGSYQRQLCNKCHIQD
ncbi:MAG: hypothetical protein M0033_00155 [Nitrospiraceae bacterium]|nr:hypothetical protein [Nitrospiraceae bacterium]